MKPSDPEIYLFVYLLFLNPLIHLYNLKADNSLLIPRLLLYFEQKKGLHLYILKYKKPLAAKQQQAKEDIKYCDLDVDILSFWLFSYSILLLSVFLVHSTFMLYIPFDIVLGRKTKAEGGRNSITWQIPNSYQETIYSVKYFSYLAQHYLCSIPFSVRYNVLLTVMYTHCGAIEGTVHRRIYKWFRIKETPICIF